MSSGKDPFANEDDTLIAKIRGVILGLKWAREKAGCSAEGVTAIEARIATLQKCINLQEESNEFLNRISALPTADK